MKRRIKTALLLLSCLMLLAACGDGEVKPLVDNPQTRLQPDVERVSGLIVMIAAEGDEGFAAYDSMMSDDLDYFTNLIQQTYGLRTDFSVVLDGAHSYADAKELLLDNELEDRVVNAGGSLFDAGAIEYDVDEDSVIVEAHFKTLKPDDGGHDGIVEIIYDKNLHITSITVNTVLGLGESMKRAGTNTLIGMGTVFIMLILIALIISLLKYIPGVVEGIKSFFTGSASADKSDSVDKAIAGIVEREEAQQSAGTDDTELVAVIAAAIAAYGGASSTDGFVVRSIKRIR